MKALLLFLTIGLLPTDTIDSNSIDGISIGMPIKDFIETVSNNRIVKKEKINLEGDSYDIYNVYDNGELLYAVEPDCELNCRVWRIWIYSSDYKTKKGLGIGNSLSDLRKNYTITDFVTGEGRVEILVKESELSFLLNASKIPQS